MIRNIKKGPDCSVIYDYRNKLLPNSETNQKNISNRLEYLTNNNTPNNRKDSYFIVNETDQNMPDISPEQIPCPVNFETPSVKLKTPSKNRPHRSLSHNKDYLQDLVKSIPYEEECSTVASLPDGTEIYKY